jgi:hypothetical protein
MAVLGTLILLIAAAVLALYLTVWKKKGGGTSSDPNAPGANPSGTPQAAAVTGGDGSKVKTEDGTTFTYSNPYGGYWYWDENDPLNNGAKAQSWTPALNETFKYGTDKIWGLVYLSLCLCLMIHMVPFQCKSWWLVNGRTCKHYFPCLFAACI